jgi:Na+-transporting NADH:ubiquinone oxidoreductase subunit NqrC
MDRTTKILLTALAASLCVNAALYILRPAQATTTELEQQLTTIKEAVVAIHNGTCPNHKICN